MPRYDYHCGGCGHTDLYREVRFDSRDEQTCDRCGAPARRLPHILTVQCMVPESFHTSTEEVMGTKDEINAALRSGEIRYKGPGHRWV